MRRSHCVRRIRIVAILVIIHFMAIIVVPCGSGDLVEDGSSNIGKDDYWRAAIASPDYLIPFEEYDRITVDINVTSGGPVDVYILRSDEYEKFQKNESFKAEFSRERVNKTSFRWEKDSDYPYMYLVVDNTDNAHTNDAVPDSDVQFEYSYYITERHHDVEMQQFWMKAIVVLAIITVGIFIGVRKALD